MILVPKGMTREEDSNRGLPTWEEPEVCLKMTKFCPEKFEPRPKDVEWAKFAFKITDDEAKRQLELLRDREFRRNYTDWNRVYRNWMRKADVGHGC